MTNVHLTSYALATRWHLKPRTLERWRWQGKGLSYCKVGNRILYRVSDIEDFECPSMNGDNINNFNHLCVIRNN